MSCNYGATIAKEGERYSYYKMKDPKTNNTLSQKCLKKSGDPWRLRSVAYSTQGNTHGAIFAMIGRDGDSGLGWADANVWMKGKYLLAPAFCI